MFLWGCQQFLFINFFTKICQYSLDKQDEYFMITPFTPYNRTFYLIC